MPSGRKARQVGSDLTGKHQHGVDLFPLRYGGDAFAIIRSYLSTRRKQSDDSFNSLVLTFQDSPPMPLLE